MGTVYEAPVLEVLRLFDAGDFRPNLDRISSLFAENASYQMSVPGREPLLGRERIVGELQRQAGDYKDCECEILTVVSAGPYVVTERVDHVTMLHSGLRVHNPLLAIFEVDDDFRIVSWREYWDALSLSLRMGVEPAHMQQLMGMSAS